MVGFLAGALVDVSLASSVLGLRALVYTVVAYLAVRTRARADSGAFAIGIWAGFLPWSRWSSWWWSVSYSVNRLNWASRMFRRLIQVPVTNCRHRDALLAVPLARLLQRARGVTV